ncbi:MAG: hypothetical protein M1834_002576 [Cirrosporium novae-zelandiae]|nr:MAG: hypothetical protein M1834_002576 [Cirrosporium novae-zelandiae]
MCFRVVDEFTGCGHTKELICKCVPASQKPAGYQCPNIRDGPPAKQVGKKCQDCIDDEATWASYEAAMRNETWARPVTPTNRANPDGPKHYFISRVYYFKCKHYDHYLHSETLRNPDDEMFLTYDSIDGGLCPNCANLPDRMFRALVENGELEKEDYWKTWEDFKSGKNVPTQAGSSSAIENNYWSNAYRDENGDLGPAGGRGRRRIDMREPSPPSFEEVEASRSPASGGRTPRSRPSPPLPSPPHGCEPISRPSFGEYESQSDDEHDYSQGKNKGRRGGPIAYERSYPQYREPSLAPSNRSLSPVRNNVMKGKGPASRGHPGNKALSDSEREFSDRLSDSGFEEDYDPKGKCKAIDKGKGRAGGPPPRNSYGQPARTSSGHDRELNHKFDSFRIESDDDADSDIASVVSDLSDHEQDRNKLPRDGAQSLIPEDQKLLDKHAAVIARLPPPIRNDTARVLGILKRREEEASAAMQQHNEGSIPDPDGVREKKRMEALAKQEAEAAATAAAASAGGFTGPQGFKNPNLPHQTSRDNKYTR